MARTGRPATPTALRLLRGNPSRRPVPPDEPKPEAADAAPPSDLAGAALAVWQDLAPRLVAVGLLSHVDVPHLARACRLMAKANELWREAEAEPMAASRLGEKRQAQALTTALKLWEAADKILYRFGITPSERTQLRGQGSGEPKDRLAAHLAKRPTVPRRAPA